MSPGNDIDTMTSSRRRSRARPRAGSKPSPNAAPSARAGGRVVGSRYLRPFTSARDWAGADPTLAELPAMTETAGALLKHALEPANSGEVEKAVVQALKAAGDEDHEKRVDGDSKGD